MYSIITMAMDKSVCDIRKFGLEFLHNKQDEHKNTFWHMLAIESEKFDDWSQVEQRMNLFKQSNKDWLPNPLIENEHGRSAKKEAKEVFKKSGNPVAALLVRYLHQTEYNYLNKVALKSSRDDMLVMQKYQHPNHLNK